MHGSGPLQNSIGILINQGSNDNPFSHALDGLMKKTWPFGIGLRRASVKDVHQKSSVEDTENYDDQLLGEPGKETTAFAVDDLRCFVKSSTMIRPFVKLHIVDCADGHYIRCLFDKNSSNNYCKRGVLAPQCTLPCQSSLQEEFFQWKEDLVVPIQFQSLINMGNVLVLIELLDFDHMQTGMQNYEIAWGIIKWRQKDFECNPERPEDEQEMKYKVRLFKYRRFSSFIRKQATCRNVDDNAPTVFLQYLHQHRKPFLHHSYINISMKPCAHQEAEIIAPNEAVQDNLDREGIAIRGETQIMSKEQEDFIARSRIPSYLERVADETCRPTTKLFRMLNVGRRALAISFSPSGKLLAVGSLLSTGALSNMSIVCHVHVYFTGSGLLYHAFPSPHHGNIYDLKWNKDETLLVSASEDGTSKIWLTYNSPGGQEKLIDEDSKPRLAHVFQHLPPQPIHCALFEPRRAIDRHSSNCTSYPRVITGCCDGKLRIWKVDLHEKNILIIHKHCILAGCNNIHHHVSVTALESDEKMGRLYSGDKCGCIIIWGKQRGAAVNETQYIILRRLDKLREFHNVPITNLHICHHFGATGRKGGHLLISGVGSIVRFFCLSTQRLDSCIPIIPTNQQMPGKNDVWTRAYFSPDGRYLVFGGNNNVQLWDSDNGHILPVSTCRDKISTADNIGSMSSFRKV